MYPGQSVLGNNARGKIRLLMVTPTLWPDWDET